MKILQLQVSTCYAKNAAGILLMDNNFNSLVDAVEVIIHQEDILCILGNGCAAHHEQSTCTKRHFFCRHCVVGRVDADLELQEFGNSCIYATPPFHSIHDAGEIVVQQKDV